MKAISDDELLRRQFRHEDPEDIAGLCRDRPDQNLEPEIIGYYQVRPTGGRAANPDTPYIWCCHCQKPTHWNGRVVKDNSEHTYIIGAHCGRQHYGDKFVAIDRMFDEQIARKALLERWSALLQLRDNMLGDLGQVFADPIWQTIDLKRQELHRAAPDLMFRLTPLVRRDGDLVIRERVRDHAAEEQRRQSFERAKAIYRALPNPMQAERRREGLAPELDDRPLYRDVEENLGPVRGKHAVTDDGDVRSYAITLRGLMAGMKAIDQLGGMRNTQLSATMRSIREAGDGLAKAFEETSGAWRFFEPKHLAAVARWYGSIKASHYSKEGPGQGRGVLTAIAALDQAGYYYPPALDRLLGIR